MLRLILTKITRVINLSQHDYNVANQTFPSTRSDINNALSAGATLNSGTTAPTTTFANQFWVDTTTNLIKQRNSANSAWLVLGKLDKNGWLPTYAGNPTSNVTPNFEGEFLYDSTNDAMYLARGTANTDWFNITGEVANYTSIAYANSPYTAVVTDDIIRANTTDGDITVNLYAASGNAGRKLIITKSASGNIVTIDPNSSELINGLSTITLRELYDTVELWCDGFRWYMTSNVGVAKSPGVVTMFGSAYHPRAWGAINSDTGADLSGTYSQSGTTVTVTATAHGYIAGNQIYSNITSGTGVDGVYTVASVTDANTFTYTAGTSLTTSGNITLERAALFASGNVASVAQVASGDLIINWKVAMPDANYGLIAICQHATGYTSGNASTCVVFPADATWTRTEYCCRIYLQGGTGGLINAERVDFVVMR